MFCFPWPTILCKSFGKSGKKEKELKKKKQTERKEKSESLMHDFTKVWMTVSVILIIFFTKLFHTKYTGKEIWYNCGFLNKIKSLSPAFKIILRLN